MSAHLLDVFHSIGSPLQQLMFPPVILGGNFHLLLRHSLIDIMLLHQKSQNSFHFHAGKLISFQIHAVTIAAKFVAITEVC